LNIDVANLDAVLFSYFWLNIQSVKEFLEQRGQKDIFAITENADIKPLLNLNYAYNPNPMRATFFSVAENETIMFPNLQDGWATLFHTITNSLKTKSCYMKIIDSNKIVDASNCFIYCEDSQERIVYTLKDNKWVFFEQGIPLSFENTAYYAARQKKERLSKAIMLEYCEKIGISKNGNIELNTDKAFSYESRWTGEFSNSNGFGNTSFIRK